MSDEHFPSESDDDFVWDWKDALTVTFTLKPNDVFAALLGTPQRGGLPKLTIALAIILVGLAVMFFALMFSTGETPATQPLFGIVCALVVGCFLLIALLFLGVWLLSRRFVRQTRVVQGPQMMAVGVDGVAVASEVSRTEYRWAAFVKVVETDRSIHFFVTGLNAVVLPLRAVPDPDDRRELRQLLRAGMGDKAQLRRGQDLVLPRAGFADPPDAPEQPRPIPTLRGERSDTVRTTFTLTTWDAFRANLAIQYRRPIVWILYAVMCLTMVAFMSSTLANANDIDADAYPLFIFFVIAYHLGLAALVLSTTPLVAWLGSRALVRRPAARGPQRFVADADGFTITQETTRARLQWRAFAKVVETRRDFLFYFSRARAMSVPKRALPDRAERDRLREFIRAGLGDKAYLRRD